MFTPAAGGLDRAATLGYRLGMSRARSGFRGEGLGLGAVLGFIGFAGSIVFVGFIGFIGFTGLFIGCV